jgi:hypothetical protein
MLESLIKELEKIGNKYNSGTTTSYYVSSFDHAYRNGFNVGTNEMRREIRNMVNKYKRRINKAKIKEVINEPN